MTAAVIRVSGPRPEIPLQSSIRRWQAPSAHDATIPGTAAILSISILARRRPARYYIVFNARRLSIGARP